MSYDNTVGLSASSWRHVAFIERPADPSADAGPGGQDLSWLMASDVCKHCTDAACLDVCPTGALMRTEFGTVVVQDDICNGCGYCVSACPFGVIGRRRADGGAHKCTLCYDRITDGLTPACAKACPTESIQFGPLDELREIAQQRVTDLHETGQPQARLYGEDPADGVGGSGRSSCCWTSRRCTGCRLIPGDDAGPGPDVAAWPAIAARRRAGRVVASGRGSRS